MPGLKEKIRSLSVVPNLVILQVGKRPDSTAFIRAKQKLAKELGILEQHLEVPETAAQDEVIETVKKLNADSTVHGIIVQLPLPSHMNVDEIIESIDPKKDVDGLTSFNMKALASGNSAIMPATARGIKEFLAFNEISIKGKTVTVVGRSKMVGKPIADMCKQEGAHVLVGHKGTSDADLISMTKKADIIIVATGHPLLITEDHVKTGQVVIDVGITRSADSGLIGDVDFESVKEIVFAISPVPGGVGPMTVFALFENLVDLCK